MQQQLWARRSSHGAGNDQKVSREWRTITVPRQDVLEHVLRVDGVEGAIGEGQPLPGDEPHDEPPRPPVLADHSARKPREDHVRIEPAVAALVPPVATDLQEAHALCRKLRRRDQGAIDTLLRLL